MKGCGSTRTCTDFVDFHGRTCKDFQINAAWGTSRFFFRNNTPSKYLMTKFLRLVDCCSLFSVCLSEAHTLEAGGSRVTTSVVRGTLMRCAYNTQCIQSVKGETTYVRCKQRLRALVEKLYVLILKVWNWSIRTTSQRNFQYALTLKLCI
jgi:hypothetical protein